MGEREGQRERDEAIEEKNHKHDEEQKRAGEEKPKILSNDLRRRGK